MVTFFCFYKNPGCSILSQLKASDYTFRKTRKNGIIVIKSNQVTNE